MDDVVNRFAKELADAIAAAVADNAEVEACRAKAREAGFDMRVTLEAVVGFVNRNSGAAVTKVTTASVAERNGSGRDGGSQERDFGHPERVRSSNYLDQLDQ